jgi:hypothetical protein
MTAVIFTRQGLAGLYSRGPVAFRRSHTYSMNTFIPTKRYLIHVAGHNLGILMRLLIGAGIPKEAAARLHRQQAVKPAGQESVPSAKSRRTGRRMSPVPVALR